MSTRFLESVLNDFSITDPIAISTTTTTSTLSPYVQEIFNTNRFRNHHHHGKLKKKHRRQHHRKHYRNDDWDEGTIFTHPVNHHRARQMYHNRHHVAASPQDRHHHQPSYRTNYPQYQGRVSFYDDSNRLETRKDVDQYMGGAPTNTAKDKWPYFAQVKTHLDEMDDELPPYLKKYKKRNRQLIDLLEGTLPPDPNKRKNMKKHFHNHKNSRWLEEDLFEAQRPNNRNSYSNKFIYEPPTTPHPNDLPGENVHINPNDNDNENNNNNHNTNNNNDENSFKHNLTISNNHSLITNNHSPPFKISSRAGQFVYHTVTAAPSAAGSSGNAIKKKRLPFVAITDRKIGPRKNTNINNSNNNEQNHLPMP